LALADDGDDDRRGFDWTNPNHWKVAGAIMTGLSSAIGGSAYYFSQDARPALESSVDLHAQVQTHAEHIRVLESKIEDLLIDLRAGASYGMAKEARARFERDEAIVEALTRQVDLIRMRQDGLIDRDNARGRGR
jgi:hypothetical protein